MWTEEFPGFDITLPGEERFEIAAHVADAGDAVGEKQRKQGVFAPGGVGVHAGEVNVHIPQAGDQEFAAAIDNVC